MNKEDLRKLVDHEIQWIKYYAHERSKHPLHLNDHLVYDRLVSIGYTKRVLSLDRRCPATILTSQTSILSDDLELVQPIGEPRDHSKNYYTPLEVWIIKFPNDVDWILEYIKK